MKPKAYRRLTRALFLLLFAVFFLLYLLLSQGGRDSPAAGGSGLRKLDMGVVTLSEIRSGGFILSELPIPESTAIGASNFDENVLLASASLYNEGAVAVKVSANLYGTDLKTQALANTALHCAVYYYSGESNPVGTEIGAFLADPAAQFHVYPWSEKQLELHVDTARYPLAFSLAPGEHRTLVMAFWVDSDTLPLLTDLQREAYSVTVKLTSRAA